MKPIQLIIAAVALVLASLPAAMPRAQDGAADEGSQEQGGVFVDTIDVNVVNVDVYVTDDDGNPLTGLTADDFVVEEDGRPVAITNFYVVEDGRPATPGEAAPDATAAAETADPPAPVEPIHPAIVAAQQSELPAEQRLNLIVYVDNYNLRPFQRNRVIREVKDFLRNNLELGDRVMLVTYDRELHIRHPFTTDPRVVASALLELETMSGHAVHRESERRDALERIDDARSVSEALTYARTYAGSIYNDLSFTISNLRDFVGQLEGLPGRKALLYVSEGVPMIAGEDLFYAVQNKFGQTTAVTQALEFDASRRFRELAAAANANRVTFYTIDAGGLRTYSYADVSQHSPGQGVYVDQVYISNLQNPLQMLAQETGGRAIINTNRVMPSLLKVAEDFDFYYSLGYSSGAYSDGRYHSIKVELKDRPRGVTVRHRLGYRGKPADVRMTDGTRSLLMHRTESNPLGVQLGFGPQKNAERGNFLVNLLVTIPLGKIVLLPADDTHQARLRLYVTVMDEDGDLSEVQKQQIPISIPAADLAQAQQQNYLFAVQLLMRGGPHEVAVGLRDELASESSFVSARINVGS